MKIEEENERRRTHESVHKAGGNIKLFELHSSEQGVQRYDSDKIGEGANEGNLSHGFGIEIELISEVKIESWSQIRSHHN